MKKIISFISIVVFSVLCIYLVSCRTNKSSETSAIQTNKEFTDRITSMPGFIQTFGENTFFVNLDKAHSFPEKNVDLKFYTTVIDMPFRNAFNLTLWPDFVRETNFDSYVQAEFRTKCEQLDKAQPTKLGIVAYIISYGSDNAPSAVDVYDCDDNKIVRSYTQSMLPPSHSFKDFFKEECISGLKIVSSNWEGTIVKFPKPYKDCYTHLFDISGGAKQTGIVDKTVKIESMDGTFTNITSKDALLKTGDFQNAFEVEPQG